MAIYLFCSGIGIAPFSLMLTHSAGEKLIRIGTAGWNLPSDSVSEFPTLGSNLERYSQKLSCVEINTSFYRDHTCESYARWAISTPEDFQFSIKLSKSITHAPGLRFDLEVLKDSFRSFAHLGTKLGVVLLQFPPSAKFSASGADRLFTQIRKMYGKGIALEPRHPSWISAEAKRIYAEYSISKVFAHPEPCRGAEFEELGGGGFFYFRLHGTPDIYRSDYSLQDRIELAETLRLAAQFRKVWCVFDNTTFGCATRNALWLESEILRATESCPGMADAA